MGFFDKLKSMVGIGNPKIELQLDSTQINRGESIKATVKLTGGSRDTPIKMFIAEHVEVLTRREWSDTAKKMVDKKVKTTVNKVEIPKNEYMLKPGEVIEETIELAVSRQAMASGHPYAHRFEVSADCPGLDPRAKQDIYII